MEQDLRTLRDEELLPPGYGEEPLEEELLPEAGRAVGRWRWILGAVVALAATAGTVSSLAQLLRPSFLSEPDPEPLPAFVSGSRDITTTRRIFHGAEGSLERAVEELAEEVRLARTKRERVAKKGSAKRYSVTPLQHIATSYTLKCNNPSTGCTPPSCVRRDDISISTICTAGTNFCERLCLVLESTQPNDYVPGDGDGHPLVCGSEGASAGPGQVRTVRDQMEWLQNRSEFVSIDLWGGGGGGAGPRKVDLKSGLGISYSESVDEAWVCGGGGGGGSHVKALVELQPGHTYRVEVGRGGRGSKDGTRAGDGQTSRLLEQVPGEPWRVLAEAAGGFGAGPYNAEFQYCRGGKGGFTSPHKSHLATNVGEQGEASRASLEGPAAILPPQKIISVVDGEGEPTTQTRLAYCCGQPHIPEPSPSDPNYYYANQQRQQQLQRLGSVGVCRTNIRPLPTPLTLMCTPALPPPNQPWQQAGVRSLVLEEGGGRRPCGDGVARWACKQDSDADFFLTCSSTWALGQAMSHCFGMALIRGPQTVAPLSSDVYPPEIDAVSTKPPEWLRGPRGGRAAAPDLHGLQYPSGQGGSGACPVMDLGPEEGLEWILMTATTKPVKTPSNPQGARGERGKRGLAVLNTCHRRGAYILALQRCTPTTAWTLHGLWPDGVWSCQKIPFTNSDINDFYPHLTEKWPSCQSGVQDADFWKHEWEKHGTCMGMKTHQYFLLAMQLLGLFEAHCPPSLQKCHLCLTAKFQLCKGIQLHEA